MWVWCGPCAPTCRPVAVVVYICGAREMRSWRALLALLALLALATVSRAVEVDVEQLEENEEAQQDRDEPTADVVSQIVEQADDVDLQRCGHTPT